MFLPKKKVCRSNDQVIFRSPKLIKKCKFEVRRPISTVVSTPMSYEEVLQIVSRIHDTMSNHGRCIVRRRDDSVHTPKNQMLGFLRDKVSLAQTMYKEYIASGKKLVINGKAWTQFDSMWASSGPLGGMGVGKPNARKLSGGHMCWIFDPLLKDKDPGPPVSWISKEFVHSPLSATEKATRFKHMLTATKECTKGSFEMYFGSVGLKMFEQVMGITSTDETIEK